MTPQDQLKAFEEHVKAINRKLDKSKSSLKDLFNKLEKQIKDKKVADLDDRAEVEAIKKSKSDGDEKYEKYQPALDALFEVWGTDEDYDSSPVTAARTANHVAFHNKSRDLKPNKLKNLNSFTGDKVPGKPILRRKATYDYLIFYGSHGDCKKGEPTQLNGLPTKEVKALIERFTKKKITFKNVVLDCCMTASFVPMFAPLLAKGEGNIISSWGPASEVIAGLVDNHAKLADATCAFIDNITNGISEMMGTSADEVFMPLALYVHGTKTLHRKKYTDLQASFNGNPSNSAGDYPDLAAMDKYLKGKGVKINEVTAADLKKLIKASVTVAT